MTGDFNDKAYFPHTLLLTDTQDSRWKKLLSFLCKYKKLKNSEVSCIFEETSVFSIICSKCEDKDKIHLKKKNRLR